MGLAPVASPRVVLAAAAASQAAVSLVGFGMPSIGPAFRDEYGLSLAALGAVLTANLVGSGIALLPSGVLVDRYGSRRPLIGGSVVAAGGLATAAHASSTALVIIALFVTGVGAAMIPVAGFGALFRVYGPARRAWALGVRQMAVPLGGSIAAALLPALEALGGLRLALLFCGGAVLTFGLAFAIVAEEGPPVHVRPRIEVHRIVRAPGMGRLLLVAMLYIVVLQSIISYTVPSLRDEGFSALAAGATFFVLNVTAGVARIVWGRVADLGGGGRRVRTLAETGALAAIGAAVFTAALHGGTASVVPAMVVFAFGALGWNALVYVIAGEMAPPGLAAQAAAVPGAIIFVVGAASAPPMGALAAHVGWDGFWLVAAAIAAAGSLVASTLPRATALGTATTQLQE